MMFTPDIPIHPKPIADTKGPFVPGFLFIIRVFVSGEKCFNALHRVKVAKVK
jgi:hypothetical protein